MAGSIPWVDEATAEGIERLANWLNGCTGRAFFIGIPRYLRTLTADPMVRLLVLEAIAESRELNDSFATSERKSIRILRRLRRTLVRHFPAVDDSSLTPPERPTVEWETSLASFDALAAENPHRPDFRVARPTEVGLLHTSKLTRLLRAKLRELASSLPMREGQLDNDDSQVQSFLKLKQQLDVAEREAEQNFRRAYLDAQGSAGLALDRLARLANRLSPSLATRNLLESVRQEMWEQLIDFSVGIENLDALVFGSDPQRTLAASPGLQRAEEELKASVVLVTNELLRLVNSRRSLRAVVARYKTRSEQFDAARLRRVASGEKRRAERSLAEEARKYFFDAGLDPIAEPQVAGGLRPDMLDPGSLYVEAKQYGAGSNVGQVARGGYRQLINTAHRLVGTKHAVREAVLLVFRRSGDHLILPDSVPGPPFVVHCCVVDIGESRVSGSRHRGRIVNLSVAELLSG